MIRQNQFGSSLEAIVYPALLLVVMWLVFWADHLFPGIDFYKFGVKPQDFKDFKGVFLMPLIHSKREIGHIVNNSFPTAVLLAALIFYYRDIAFRVFSISWIGTGLGVLVFASDANSYHIGMSGVVYALAGFLFTSGVIRRHRSLQGISLFVAFVYGSMIWGVFPTDAHVSWEGHLAGMVMGVTLAFIYRKFGPQPPKYMYEIERDLGIEPPDLEGEWNEKVRIETERLAELKQQKEEPRVIYDYIEKVKNDTK